MTTSIGELESLVAKARGALDSMARSWETYCETLGAIHRGPWYDEKGHKTPAHMLLGYDTFAEMLDSEFGSYGVKPPTKDRPELSIMLKHAGLSARAAGKALGVDEGTIRNDIKATAENSADGLPGRVTGLDGRDRPATRQPKREVPPDNGDLKEFTLDASGATCQAGNAPEYREHIVDRIRRLETETYSILGEADPHERRILLQVLDHILKEQK